MLSEVTLIIKTFERPAHLRRLVESIRKYYPDIYIIIADDSEKHDPIRNTEYHVLPFDTGLSAGRNFLVSMVRTKYFILLDDDFYFTEETKIENFLWVMEESDLDMLGGMVKEGNELWNHFGSFDIKGRDVFYTDEVLDCGEYKLADIILNFFIGRTESFIDIKWDDHLKTTEHFDFFYNLKGKKKVGYFDGVTIGHYRDSLNTSLKYKEMRARREQYFRYILKKNGIDKLVSFTETISIDK